MDELWLKVRESIGNEISDEAERQKMLEETTLFWKCICEWNNKSAAPSSESSTKRKNTSREKMIEEEPNQEKQPQRRGWINYEALNREEEPLSEDVKNLIRAKGGDVENMALVIQKIITRTDIEAGQARFLMPIIKLKNNEFLTHEERKNLLRKEAIKIQFIEPCGEVNENLELRMWLMKKENKRKSSGNYVITETWNSVSRRKGHELEYMKDIVQVWAYRVGNKLGLAMVKLPRIANEEDSGSRAEHDDSGQPSSSTPISSSVTREKPSS